MQHIFGAIGWLSCAERVAVLIHVFDAGSLGAVHTHALPFEFGLSSAQFSRDGRVMALGGHDGEIALIDVESGACVKKFSS